VTGQVTGQVTGMPAAQPTLFDTLDVRYDAVPGTLFDDDHPWSWCDDRRSHAKLNRMVQASLRVVFPSIRRILVGARAVPTGAPATITLMPGERLPDAPGPEAGADLLLRIDARVRATVARVRGSGNWIVRRKGHGSDEDPVWTTQDPGGAVLFVVTPATLPGDGEDGDPGIAQWHQSWWDLAEAVPPQDLPSPVFAALFGWRDRPAHDRSIVLHPYDLARMVAWGATRYGWCDPAQARHDGTATEGPLAFGWTSFLVDETAAFWQPTGMY